MALTNIQHRDIMHEYDLIQSKNYQLSLDRKEEIYTAIPEIREIDDEIAHSSISTAKYMIFHPGENRREGLKKQIEELRKKKLTLLCSHGYPEDYLDPIYDCPQCKDTGYIGAEKCVCFRKRHMKLLYEQSHIGEILKEENFATFNLQYYSDEPLTRNLEGLDEHEIKISPRSNMQEILSRCNDFIDTFDRTPGQNLLIFGNTGVGKTFLTNCIAGKILAKEHSVIYLSAQQLFHELEHYAFHTKQYDKNELPDYLTCDLLIIDDLGTELNNSFINTQLFLCMNDRIQRNKSTVINTNLDLGLISRTYTERVSSRIIQYYDVLHIYGEDIRLKKAFAFD